MIEDRIKELGLKLPSPTKPAGSYVPFVTEQDMIYISGQIPLESNILPESYKGKATSVVSIETAQEAARICTLNALSHIKVALGSLDRVRKIVRLSGYVNSDPTFTEQPKVINAASNLLTDIFGDAGRHSRLAIGVSSLPLGSVVEIEFIVKSETTRHE
jgi:enamine deaminase RidA (YjgF/YER057c/UK114 family)